MTDIALIWHPGTSSADIALVRGALAVDEGLRTAILISLFTDARARNDDPLPEEGADPRGWWGNGFAEVDGDQIGSRLWLLAREKVLSNVLERARDYARESLQWLIRDGICTSIDMQVEAQGNRLAIGVTLARPSGPARQRYDFVWEATA